MLGDSDSESSSSSSSSLNALKINEDYASVYARRKEREELSRLKEKYGSGGSDGSDSESETEDEDGEELTPAVDAAILRTLARIRRRDPSIYENTRTVFQEEQERTSTSAGRKKSKKDKSKPLTIKQHALNAVLSGSRSPSPDIAGPTHVEEQRHLRDETIRAFADAADGEADDFLVPREKTKDELEMEEEEYRAFLEREVGEDIAGLVEVETEEQWREHDGDEDGTEQDGKKQKKKKSAAKGKEKQRDEDADQKFLLDYILNRGWIDKTERRVPTYKEITSKPGRKAVEDSDGAQSQAEDDNAGSGDEESTFEEAADHFEEDYHFRFQEPGAATIGAHPRKITALVRREDTRRKEARERRKARKEEEKLLKREEVKRLKALKLKELRRKLERIGREGGKGTDDNAALEALDLEAEWDPDKHDAQMADLYGDEAEVDNDKPQWDDDIDIGDIMPPEPEDASPKKQKKKKKRKRDADDGGDDAAAIDLDAMDADVTREYEPEEEWDGTEEMRKRKLQEYMDTLDEMEFNDIVGGMPTRFKYTTVGTDDFGLAPAEILMATDADLNQYVGVKRYAPYRKNGAGKWDPKRGERLRELRDKLKERGVPLQDGADAGEKKKRKGKKERMREKAATDATQDEEVPTAKKKKRKAQEAEDG